MNPTYYYIAEVHTVRGGERKYIEPPEVDAGEAVDLASTHVADIVRADGLVDLVTVWRVAHKPPPRERPPPTPMPSSGRAGHTP